MKVHYENNSPFLTITSMTRVIEVSHWGNIAVEETVDLKHTGAVLKGPFSRYDYQRQPDSGISSVKSFKVDVLPFFFFLTVTPCFFTSPEWGKNTVVLFFGKHTQVIREY